MIYHYNYSCENHEHQCFCHFDILIVYLFENLQLRIIQIKLHAATMCNDEILVHRFCY